MGDDNTKAEDSPSGEIDLAQQELIFVDDGVSAGPDPLLGKVIDNKYKIIGKLGSGGMGAVYKGEHTLMGRTVAIKVLHPQFVSNSDLLRRFQYEAQIASRLHHPHAIEIYDFGVYRGAPYLVMQYVEGRTLKDLIQQTGALSFDLIRKVVEQFGSALSQAHQLGIVHRDLKPENVMLVKLRDGSESAVLLDFGIAKVLTPEGANTNVTMTRSGTFCGTPKYSAPEQVLERPVDHRCDIYTLGIILYEALSGEVPFDAPSFMEILVKHVNEQPKPLLQSKPNLSIPEGVEAIVLRCLKKEPSERYNSVEELLEALRAIGNTEGTQSSLQAGAFQPKQGASLGLLAGLLGGVLGVVGIAIYFLTSSPSSNENIHSSAAIAKESASSTQAANTPVKVERAPTMVASGSAKSTGSVGETTPQVALAALKDETAKGPLTESTLSSEEPSPSIQRQDQPPAPLAPSPSAVIQSSDSQQVTENPPSASQGAPAPQQEYTSRDGGPSAAPIKSLLETPPATTATSSVEQAAANPASEPGKDNVQSTGSSAPPPGVPTLEPAKDTDKTPVTGPVPNTEQAKKLAVTLFKEGIALYKKKNYVEAAAKFERATTLRTDAVGSMIALGNCYTRLNRTSEALQRYQAAIRTDPLYGPGYYNLAAFYAVTGQKAEAIAALEKATRLDSRAKSSARDEPDFSSLREDPNFKRITAR